MQVFDSSHLIKPQGGEMGWDVSNSGAPYALTWERRSTCVYPGSKRAHGVLRDAQPRSSSSTDKKLAEAEFLCSVQYQLRRILRIPNITIKTAIKIIAPSERVGIAAGTAGAEK